jgi:hypothetical protein
LEKKYKTINPEDRNFFPLFCFIKYQAKRSRIKAQVRGDRQNTISLDKMKNIESKISQEVKVVIFRLQFQISRI